MYRFKNIKLYPIYVNFGNILILEFEIIVFLFKVIWNIKLDVHLLCMSRDMVHDTLALTRLRLTWIDSRFNIVKKLIPFERALNCMQYMWIWQHSYVQHRRKLCFYIANCLIKRKQMICSSRGAIVCLNHVWIEGWMKLQYAQKPNYCSPS